MRFWDTFPAGAPGTHRFGEGRLLRLNTPNTPNVQPPVPEQPMTWSSPVTDQMREMRNTYSEALNADRQAAGPLSADAVYERIEKSRASVQSMRDKLRDRLAKAWEIEETQPALSGLVQKWKEMDRDLGNEEVNLAAMRNVAETLRSWKACAIAPIDFLDRLRTMHETPGLNVPGVDSQSAAGPVANLEAAIAQTRGSTADPLTSGDLPDVTDAMLWQTLPQGTKILVVDNLSSHACVSEKLAFLNSRLQVLEDTMKGGNFENLIKEVESADISTAQKSRDFSSSISGELNIEFFSINQIIAGFTKWKEAYKEAVKAKNERKSDKFSKKVGKMFKWLPYGEDVANALSDKVTSNQAKERKDFIDTIGTRDFGFKDLFEGDAELAKNAHSPSRFLAILEFASQKGWLYPLMKHNFIDKNNLQDINAFGFNIRQVVPQDYMTDDLLASYLNGLLNKSNANGSKDINEQMVSVEGKNDVESFLDIFDKAVKGFGYWKAIGIYRGALKKGVSPATSAIFAARLNYWLRHPDHSKYLNNTLLANFGGSSWNQIPFTMAYYAKEDKTIAQWATEGAKVDAPKDQLTRSMIQVERAVDQRTGGNLTEQQRSLFVGKALAGQTVDLGNGQYLSIFEPDFDSIVTSNPAIMQQFDDSDVIRSAPLGHFANSEIVMAPEGLLNSLFDIESTGRPTYQAKVIIFATGVIERANELTSLGRRDPRMAAAAAHFKAVMSAKLTRVIGNKLRSRANTRETLLLRFDQNSPFKGKLVFPELVNAGVLGREAIGL